MEKNSFPSECARRNEIGEMQKTVNWKQVKAVPPPIGSDGRMQSVQILTILPPILFVNVTTVASPQPVDLPDFSVQKYQFTIKTSLCIGKLRFGSGTPGFGQLDLGEN